MKNIEFFKGIPTSYESFLVQKYDSFITTSQYVEVHYPEYDVYYYLVKENDDLVQLLMFGNLGTSARCFNSLVAIDQSIVKEFVEKVFSDFPSIQKIVFEASYNTYSLEKSIMYFKSDDQIIDLPKTLDEYHAKLGSQTRKHLVKRVRKIQEDFENIKIISVQGVDIEEHIFDRIVEMNTVRMKQKGKKPGIDDLFRKDMYQFSLQYGYVVYIEIDNKIVAGSIATMLDKSVFAHVISHDDLYSKYNAGEVCLSYLLQAAIERGIESFHLLWGQTEYKRRLLAKNHDLYSYCFYRKYSLHYYVDRVKTDILDFLKIIKRSKLYSPITNFITNYRIRKCKVV